MKLHPWAGSRRKAQGEVDHGAASIDALRISLLKMSGQQAWASRRPGASLSLVKKRS